jgi:hypothetical protein
MIQPLVQELYQFLVSVSWKVSPLKSSHFQNCSVVSVSFLTCSTSDQLTADAFGNHLG